MSDILLHCNCNCNQLKQFGLYCTLNAIISEKLFYLLNYWTKWCEKRCQTNSIIILNTLCLKISKRNVFSSLASYRSLYPSLTLVFCHNLKIHLTNVGFIFASLCFTFNTFWEQRAVECLWKQTGFKWPKQSFHCNPVLSCPMPSNAILSYHILYYNLYWVMCFQTKLILN